MWDLWKMGVSTAGASALPFFHFVGEIAWLLSVAHVEIRS